MIHACVSVSSPSPSSPTLLPALQAPTMAAGPEPEIVLCDEHSRVRGFTLAVRQDAQGSPHSFSVNSVLLMLGHFALLSSELI